MVAVKQFYDFRMLFVYLLLFKVDGSESTEYDTSLIEGSTASMSSDTRVSCTSSNDDHTPSPTRKKLPNPVETSNSQFERYRYTMQKEIDALQMKSKKMESNIQSLELEKNDIKSILIQKDLELADLRAKNAALQKTVMLFIYYLLWYLFTFFLIYVQS